MFKIASVGIAGRCQQNQRNSAGKFPYSAPAKIVVPRQPAPVAGDSPATIVPLGQNKAFNSGIAIPPGKTGYVNQAPLTSAEGKLATKLTQAVSHFHQVLDLGVARGTFSASTRSHYGRDIPAISIPDFSTYQAVTDAAENVVNGEAARRAQCQRGDVVYIYDNGTTTPTPTPKPTPTPEPRQNGWTKTI
jgi:hypothetical protein